ncbi:MAG: hypothetical protein M1838_005292 [Thelocarpon superellum]|nr:MAG: hypothetical protein M1838_005292 [Thelocarpon superellum]
MRLHGLAVTWVALCSSAAHAVFVDEAYHTDFHHALLGLPQQHATFFHRPQAESKASLLYTLSAKHVVGAVNPKDGALVWRQRLEPPSSAAPAFLRAGEHEAAVISAVGGRVQAWDALDGRLVWGNEFAAANATNLEVIESAGDGGQGPKDCLVLFREKGHGVLRRLRGDTGDVAWEFQDATGDVPFQVSTSATVVYLVTLHPISRGGHKIRVTSLDPQTGRQTGQHVLSADVDVTGPESIIYVGSNLAAPIIAWADKSLTTLKVNIIGTNQINSLPITNESGEEIVSITCHAPHLVHSRTHFLVHYETGTAHWADVYHVDIATSAVSHAYHLPRLGGKGAFATSTQDANVYFTRVTESEVVLLSSASHGILERWSMPVAETQSPWHAVSEVVPKSGSSYAVRAAVVLSNGSWRLVRNGEPTWARPEALAHAVAVAWAELTEEEDLAYQLEVEGHEDVFSAYTHRLGRHFRDLQHLPSWLSRLPGRVLGGLGGGNVAKDDATLQKDSFGFRKLAIVATDNGRLFALDVAAQGRIVWTIGVVDLAPGQVWEVKGILADNERGAISVKGAQGDSIMVESMTGTVLNRLPPGSTPPVESTAYVEAESGTFIMDIYQEGDPGQIPLTQRPKGRSTMVVRGGDNVVKGITYIGDGSLLRPVTVWEFSPAPGSHITTLTSRPAHDPVASIGRVLGDRSVLYKYLNPNLLLVIAVDEATAHMTVYLLDAISGEVLYSTVHQGVDSAAPISAVLCENWIAYSFWEDGTRSGSKGYKLAVADLFESDIPNDRGPLGAARNFSSITPTAPDGQSLRPYVMRQSFAISEAITNMAVTQTRQGITSRGLLVTLDASNAILAIPRHVLDPRRPVGRDPTPAEMEEGLARYNARLDFSPESSLSHQREVMGIRHISTCPAVLESTSLVFAYGLDIFGTRATPSLAFDLLGKGFAKGQLLLTVAALFVGVGVLAPMVRKKQINAQWQAT